MKLTLAITISALLAGCAAEENSVDGLPEYADGIEVVVVDVVDVPPPSSFERSQFPGAVYERYATEDVDAQIRIPHRPWRPPLQGDPGTTDPGDRVPLPYFPPTDHLPSNTADKTSVHDPHLVGDGRVVPGLHDVYEPSRDEDAPAATRPNEVYDDSSSTTDPCTCQDTACVETWIAENLGCNVCADFICGGDHTAGACYLCADDER